MKVAVIGGVSSTDVLIRTLHLHGFGDLHVWGYAPTDTRTVSSWTDLAATCAELGVGHTPFVKVAECEAELRRFAPDLLFAVGLSQLIPRAMLEIAHIENVGFHPTALPKGRGRAPLAWLVLERVPGAATFFAIREGVDDGPIFVQRPFAVTDQDDAGSLETRVLEAEAEALDAWLPTLASGKLAPVAQDEADASWYGRRTPEDGRIDWSAAAETVLRLIRASTHPYPGALTVADDVTVTIWAARLDERPEQGVAGRILQVHGEEGFTVQSGNGLVRVLRWSADGSWIPRVGARLGYYAEAEILKLRQRCAELEQRLRVLEEIAGRKNEKALP